MIKINTQEMLNVADFFSEMHQKGGKVDIDIIESKAEVNNCGTPACIGGWLAVYYDTKKNKRKERDWWHGANTFAERLGFKDMQDLRSWAENNKELWGKGGYVMFGYEEAWTEDGGYDDKGKFTLEHASYKLRKVVGRVDEYQKQIK